MSVPISNVSRRVVLAASGTGPYSFNFEILANTDISVYRDDTLLTLTTDYTVTINTNGTGYVTLTATPTGATQIAIVGDRAIQRTTDFTTGGDLFATSLNDELDSLTIFAQQNAEGLQRALVAPQTDPTTINMTLPRKADRANKYLAFDADGNPAPGDTSQDIATVAANIDNINIVKGEITPVNNIATVAGNDANITTVAGNIANVNTVAGISGNVTTVAGIAADVTSVAGDATDIGTVATNIANVNSVATNIANVNTVAGNSTNINTVAGISADVTTVAGDSADIQLLADNIGTIAAKANAGANSDITSLSGLTTPLSVAQGGTGAATLTGVIKGNGTGAFSAATAGTDYAKPDTASTWSAGQRGTVTTDNDLSFDLTATNNFKCTPTGSGTLTFTNIASATGQSGFVLLVNGSNYTISAAATTKVSATALSTISATGTYLLSYFCDGTNVYVVNSGALS